MRDIAILKAFSMGVKIIKSITEYIDYVCIVGLFGDIEVTYNFYNDGRITIC